MKQVKETRWLAKMTGQKVSKTKIIDEAIQYSHAYNGQKYGMSSTLHYYGFCMLIQHCVIDKLPYIAILF